MRFTIVAPLLAIASLVAAVPAEPSCNDGLAKVVNQSDDVGFKEGGQTKEAVQEAKMEVCPKENPLGAATVCWWCSSPCSRTYCCNDGFPQCCAVNGLCGCCTS